MKKISLIIGIFVLASLLANNVFCKNATINHSKNNTKLKNLILSLNFSVNLIEKKGEKIFKDFYKPDSKWIKNKIAIFVIDPLTGKLLVYPPKNSIGISILDIGDINGKPLAGKIMKGENIHLKTDLSKIAVAPNGKAYAVIVTDNILELEKKFIMSLVNDACFLIKCAGKKAFSILKKKNSIFRYKDTYVYVLNDDGVCLLDPNYPSTEGKNIYNLKASDNTYPVQDILKIANSEKDGGWIKTLAISPLTKTIKDKSRIEMDTFGIKIRKKLNFVKKVKFKNRSYIVGSGVYLKKNPIMEN